MLGTTLIAGCGFHFAGSRPLPPALSSVYIEVITPYSVTKPPVEAALRSRLLRRGARVVSTLGSARTIVRITELRESREVLSVDPFGKAVEFKLTTRLSYDVAETGRDPLAPGTLTVSRDYSFNAQQVLAKEAEEQRLQNFLQDELAELLVLRLESQLAVPPAASPGVTPAP